MNAAPIARWLRKPMLLAVQPTKKPPSTVKMPAASV